MIRFLLNSSRRIVGVDDIPTNHSTARATCEVLAAALAVATFLALCAIAERA